MKFSRLALPALIAAVCTISASPALGSAFPPPPSPTTLSECTPGATTYVEFTNPNVAGAGSAYDLDFTASVYSKHRLIGTTNAFSLVPGSKGYIIISGYDGDTMTFAYEYASQNYTTFGTPITIANCGGGSPAPGHSGHPTPDYGVSGNVPASAGNSLNHRAAQ